MGKGAASGKAVGAVGNNGQWAMGKGRLRGMAI
jgi:hypothetical protein